MYVDTAIPGLFIKLNNGIKLAKFQNLRVKLKINGLRGPIEVGEQNKSYVKHWVQTMTLTKSYLWFTLL